MRGWVLCEACEGQAPFVACDPCQHRGIVEDPGLGYSEQDAAEVDITVSFELPDIELNLYEIFPDGLPEGVTLSELTAEHIIETMQYAGSKAQMFSEWNLFSTSDIGISVMVSGKPVESTLSTW